MVGRWGRALEWYCGWGAVYEGCLEEVVERGFVWLVDGGGARP